MHYVVPLLGLAVLLLIPIGLLIWGFRTCRLLWRRGTTTWGRLVYNYGVRGVGASNAVAWTVLGGYFGATNIATSADDILRCLIGTALLVALFGTPVALGFGYWIGTTMASIWGLEPDPSPKSLNKRLERSRGSRL